MPRVIDVRVDCVGCHQLGCVSKAMCVHDESHGGLEPRDHRGDGIKQELLGRIGTPWCVQHRHGPGMRPEEEGQEGASPQKRNPGPDAAALAHVRWVDPVLVSANRCLLSGASFDFGCVEPLGSGGAY
jgi:hypothetical protein